MAFLSCTNESLRRFVPGYSGLSPAEKKRINEFSLVWQIYEGRVFGFHASGQAIHDTDWHDHSAEGICSAAASSIAFFRERYVLAEGAEVRFQHLLLGPQGNGLRDCILLGLGGDSDAESRVKACAAVCFRLRNNLFYGGKAAYGYADQRENFTHGVRFLNACLRLLA